MLSLGDRSWREEVGMSGAAPNYDSALTLTSHAQVKGGKDQHEVVKCCYKDLRRQIVYFFHARGLLSRAWLFYPSGRVPATRDARICLSIPSEHQIGFKMHTSQMDTTGEHCAI